MTSQATESGAIDGLLLIDKAAGGTSHDVVNVARRALGERRIGHAGTLDPFATGLLVLLLGRATRLLPYLDGEPKVYEAVIRFGAETTTEDLHGSVTREAALPDRESVNRAIADLTGEISQVPPAFSAKRVDGQRAYTLARAGVEVDLPPVSVHVHSWSVGPWDADDLLHVTITCGGGTYVRSLARDLGRATGSAAHLFALRRVRSGPFAVLDAVSASDVDAYRDAVKPPISALPHLQRQQLSLEEVGQVARGISVPACVDGERAALMNGDSETLVALAERRSDRWQPRVVMREP